MTDFSKILLASDYDRTLTGFDGTISPANLDAIRFFTAHGGIFTVATGRSMPMCRGVIGRVPVNAPVILFNGAALCDFASGAVELLQVLPPNAPELARLILEQNPGLRLEVQCMDAHYAFGHDDLRDAFLSQNGVPVRYVDWDALPETKMKLTFYAPFGRVGHAIPGQTDPSQEAPFVEIAQMIARKYPAYIATRSMPRMIEIETAGTSKGSAARSLAQRLGRSLLICAGDAPNDLSMLHEADEAYVPADCDPAVAPLGFGRAAACAEGAIASIVERLKERK